MTEGEIQKQFAEWLRARNIPFIQPINGKRSRIQPGAQDFTVFLPGGKTLCVEMKVDKGKRSAGQIEWAEKMAAVGHHVFLFRSLAECVEQVETLSPSRPLVLFGAGVWQRNPSGAIDFVRRAQPGDDKLYPRI